MSVKQYLYALKNDGLYWSNEGIGELVAGLENATLYRKAEDWDVDEEEGDEVVTIEATLKDIGKMEKKNLTAEEIDLYIADGGTSCPYCGSDELENEDMEHCHSKTVIRTWCNVCDREWSEKYQLVGLEEIE